MQRLREAITGGSRGQQLETKQAVSTGRLSLEGIDTELLHEAVQRKPGELVFYTIPHASLHVGVLGNSTEIEDVSVEDDYSSKTGWKRGKVAITKGVSHHMLAIDNGIDAEDGSGRQLIDTMELHLPATVENIAHYTNNRGINIIVESDVSAIRERVERRDWIFAVGNESVGFAAAALAEKELDGDRGPQVSHGLLVLSTIRELGVDWQPRNGQYKEFDELFRKLEIGIIEHGIIPIVLKRLGWDDSIIYGEERIARRLKAFDLSFDEVKARVIGALLLNRATDEKLARKAQRQKDAVANAGGNYETYLNNAVDNLLTNYLGIPQEVK